MKYSDIKFFVIIFICLFYRNNLIFADTSNTQVFTIKNISVNVSSTTLSSAREIALKEAQMKGFETLMKKILLKGEYDKILNINKEKIIGFVQEIEVESEKTTPVSYIGSILVKFKQNQILNFLKSNKIKFSITKSKPLLILPIYQYGGVTYLWDDENIWKDLWSDTSTDEGLIPIKSSDGKFTDFMYINPNQAIKKNLKNLERIANSYNSTGVLVAILKKKFNRDKTKINLDLDLFIYRFDGGKDNHFQDSTEIEINQYSDELLLSEKVKVQDFVNNQWKVENILATTKNSVKLTINYNNIKDWINIKNIVGTIPIVERYTIDKFSKNIAVISLFFSGNYNQLQIAFKQSDLEFDINNKSLQLVR